MLLMMPAAVASKPVRPSAPPVPETAPEPAASSSAAADSPLLSTAVAMVVPASASPRVTESDSRWVMVLVRTTMAVAALPAARMASRSMVPSASPALTASPTLTPRSKGSPSSSTVSTPRWTRTSRPESALNPMACPVPATMVTVASTGETMVPSSGSTPSPSPTALEEKTGSGTSARSMTLPVTGEAIGTSRSIAGLAGRDMTCSFRSVVLSAGRGGAAGRGAVLRGGQGSGSGLEDD